MSLAENVAALPLPRGGNYELSRLNALQHGVLSQHTVLPWEDREEYLALLEALVAEHKPQGPTEEHLAHLIHHSGRGSPVNLALGYGRV